MGNIFLTLVVCFLLNIAVFTGLVQDMAAGLEAPGLMPVKAVLILCAVEALAILTVYVVRFMKSGKNQKRTEGSLAQKVKKDYKQILILAGAGVAFLCAATTYLRFVPSEAVTVMADINRVDLFCVTNSNSIIMMAYYIKSLTGISAANVVCVAIPFFFYIPVVCAFWEVASALFVEDAYKRNLCFLAEAILVLFGNCMYSMTGMIGGGLLDLTNIALVLSLLVSFAVCFRIYHATKKADIIVLAIYELIMLVCVYCMDVTAFALSAMTVLIFALLLIGRRYLPWLKSSN